MSFLIQEQNPEPYKFKRQPCDMEPMDIFIFYSNFFSSRRKRKAAFSLLPIESNSFSKFKCQP